jgi:pimeloyl-ACP methyl ester carboxylesterase
MTREGVAELGDTALAYRDSGGEGEVVVLLHPASGSREVWEHQWRPLQEAGFRVLAYSRRGHAGSAPFAKEAPGTGSGDLLALLDRLGIGRCHLVGVAGGGIVAVDAALSQPRRLASLTLACTILGVVDPEYVALGARLRPPGFEAMPVEFQELGPSYRAENPDGVARWLELEHRAHPLGRPRQPSANRITWAALRRMEVPTLVVTGDADLWSPPSVQRLFLRHLPRAEGVVIPECGHSAHWEQPEAFNAALVAFLRRHAAG